MKLPKILSVSLANASRPARARGLKHPEDIVALCKLGRALRGRVD